LRPPETEGKTDLNSAEDRITGSQIALPRLALSAAAALAVVALALVAFAPGSARANEPFTLEFDQSSIQPGFLGALPVGELSGPSKIEGTVDEQGNIKIAKGDFTLPVLDVSTLARSAVGIDLPVEIQGYMGIEQAATGTYDRETGRMEIQTKAGLWVSINIQQALAALGGLGVSLPPELGAITGLLGQNLTCGFSPMDVTFTTEPTSLGEGQRFTKGLHGPGALAAEWSQLGPFAGKTKILGFIDACTTIRGLLPTLLSGLGGSAGIDLGGLPIDEILGQLDQLDLRPTGLTITRTLDESPAPAAVRLKLARKVIKVKPGKVARFRLRVANSGGTASPAVRLCARVPRSVSGGGCRSLGTIAPDKAKSSTFRLKASGERARSAKVVFMLRSGASVIDKSSAWISKSRR
jgi:hypothetical protein